MESIEQKPVLRVQSERNAKSMLRVESKKKAEEEEVEKKTTTTTHSQIKIMLQLFRVKHEEKKKHIVYTCRIPQSVLESNSPVALMTFKRTNRKLHRLLFIYCLWVSVMAVG